MDKTFIYTDVSAYSATMMTAQQIGSKLAIKSTLIGILTAYLIMTSLIAVDEGIYAFLWLFDFAYWPNLLLGAFGLLLMGYFFGRRAGTEIIEQQRDSDWVGIKYGFITLITGTIIGSTIGFFQEGVDNIGTNDNPFEDYYFKPLFWVTIFGLIPVVLVGIWFGRQIKRKGKFEKIKNGN